LWSSNPGTPASDTVGRSGYNAERREPVNAIGRTLPLLMCAPLVANVENVI
jgi:hypothetical protein